MRNRLIAVGAPLFVSTAAVFAVPATGQSAAQEETGRPALFDDLLACRAIEEIAERAQCYDARVDALAQAEANNDVIIADREDVREARKGLFGFRVSDIPLFGSSKDDEEDEVKEVASAIASARQFGRGKWRVRLANGSVWEQTDSRKLVRAPREGQKVIVRRASLGSFILKIGSNPALRLRRVE
ncbi:hypothetical protein ACRAQ7_01770 [Erythrobacter sp. W53]|uniref:hypothetical protein n=1 Tax=Erythrobacter sp. W53 TaxID=3425947 RepID=UPI003D769E12